MEKTNYLNLIFFPPYFRNEFSFWDRNLLSYAYSYYFEFMMSCLGRIIWAIASQLSILSDSKNVFFRQILKHHKIAYLDSIL